jgi:hypothetical protein
MASRTESGKRPRLRGRGMLRSSLVCLGLLAALEGPSKCGGGLLASEPGDAGSARAPENSAVASPGAPQGGGQGAAQGGAQGGSTGPSSPPAGSAAGSGVGPSEALGGATLVTLASGQVCPWGMAIDATSVYWTTCGDPTGGSVLKVPKVGGTITTLATGDRLSGIAVDATNVYWIAGSSDASTGAVMKVPVNGGTPTTLTSRPGPPSHIAVDDTNVYWTEQMGGSVMKVPLGGGAPTVVANSTFPWAITVDATSVYWLGTGVMKAPKAGGPAITLTASMGPILPNAGIAVDAMNVYWASGPPAGSAGVSKVPLDGGTTTVMAVPMSMPGPIAVDGTSIYFADGSGTVLKVPLAGGAVTTLATGQTNPDAIAVDATSVYWVDNGSTVMKLTPK